MRGWIKVDDRAKTTDQLIAELEALRAEVASLKQQPAPDPFVHAPLIQLEHLSSVFFNGATQSNVGLFIVDTELRFLQINQALAHINGYSIEAHQGQLLSELLPDLAPTLTPLLHSLIKTGQPITNLEVSGYVPSQPDSLRHWLSSFFPLTNPSGAIIAVGGIVFEITDSKQTLEALRYSEENLRMAQKIAHVGSWRWDRVTQNVFWTEEMYRIHGCDPTQPPPQGADLEPYIHPDDRSLYQALTEQALAGQSFEMDLRIVRPDGEVRYVEARAEPGVFNEQGELLHLFGTLLDVTERKQVEEALRQSEFALREAQRLAHVGSWQWTRERGVVWSDEIYRIHGLDPAAQNPPSDEERAKHVHPDDLEIHKAIHEATLAGQAYEFDLRILRTDGEVRYVEARGLPGVRNEQGGIVELFGTVMDVTDRKRVEAQLRESQEQLARAQKIAHIARWDHDLTTQTCKWSDELYQIHQIDPSQPAPTGDAMDQRIHPDDLWIDRQCIKAPLLAGQPYEADLRIVRPDGEIRHVETRGEPVFDDHGRVVGFTGTVVDITDRKRIEEQLRRNEAEIRAILAAIPDMLIRVKRDGTRSFISPGNLKSYRPVECLVGGSVYDTLPPAIAHQRMTYVEKAIETKERQVYEYEILIDGKLYCEEARVVAINDEEALIVVRDITESKQLERLKAEFISVVSHELRTPLTSMQVALSLLDEQLVDPASEDGQNMVHVATAGVDRLVRLVNHILDLERLESGKLRIKKQPCNLSDLVDTAIDQMKDLANRSNVLIQTAIAPFPIHADADRLVQVLTNLLSNAIRFSPPQSTITIHADLSSPSWVQFSVQDQGRGIPGEHLESIFERFQQVDASDSREKSGTGLGLAICRNIIHQHGGHIWADSTLGQGSTFYFTLPTWDKDSDGYEAHSID